MRTRSLSACVSASINLSPIYLSVYLSIDLYPCTPQGPVFCAQLFGLSDTMCALMRVRCIPWKLFGAVWFIFGPVAFTLLATYKVHRVLKRANTLCFTPSPKRSIADMRRGLADLKGLSVKFSQLFVYFMEVRFTGGWGKKCSQAKFWGFLMYCPLPPNPDTYIH